MFLQNSRWSWLKCDLEMQAGVPVGGSATKYRRFADRSCWNRSTTDDAFWYHTSSGVWRSARLAWEDRVPTAWMGQPLPLASCWPRQHESLLIVRSSGLIWCFLMSCTLYVPIRLKVVYSSMENPSQSYGASPAIWDHTVLPATWHRWTHPALTPARQSSTQSVYLPRRNGRLISQKYGTLAKLLVE